MKIYELEILKDWALNIEYFHSFQEPVLLNKNDKKLYKLGEHVEDRHYNFYGITEDVVFTDSRNNYYTFSEYIEELQSSSADDTPDLGEPDFEVVGREKKPKKWKSDIQRFLFFWILIMIIIGAADLWRDTAGNKNTQSVNNPHIIQNKTQPVQTDNFNKAIQIWQKSHDKKIYQWRRTQLKDYVKKHDPSNLMETVKLINEYNTEVEPIEK